MMRPLFLALAALFVLSPVAEAKTIYVLRHAEPVIGTSDPGLSPLGAERAQDVADRIMAEGTPDLLLTTRYRRTIETIEPLSAWSGAQLEYYDPRLAGDIGRIRSADESTIVVVGHSNTIQALIAELGGEPGIPIDHYEYDRLYKVKLDESGKAAETTLVRTDPRPERPATGTFPVALDAVSAETLQFDMKNGAEVVGTVSWRYEPSSDALRLEEETAIERFRLDTRTEVLLSSLDAPAGTVRISGTMGTPVDVAATFSADGISGHSEVRRLVYQPQGRVPVDLEGGAIERSAALMLAHHLPVDAMPLAFEWFNGYEPGVRTIVATYRGKETVTVPAGTFETDVFELRGGAPSQTFYVSVDEPRRPIAIEVAAQPWRYELRAFETP
ncbi:MAG: histidine phosphatase family protein [Pseudomonadota bacterium]